MQQSLNPALENCIEACQRCHDVCLQMAMTHCLQQGGEHVEPEHFRLMLNCAEICQTSANFMLSNSALHGSVCAVCAEVCEACADSCEQVGQMDQCVQACRQCAQQCQSMSGGQSLQRRDSQSQGLNQRI
jgi:hypothetical protein